MRDEGTGTSILLETERLFLREMDRNDYDALYSYCKYTNEPSIRTAESIGMHSDCDYPDEANGITHVSMISKEDWLSEIGAEVINQQKEGLQDGV